MPPALRPGSLSGTALLLAFITAVSVRPALASSFSLESGIGTNRGCTPGVPVMPLPPGACPQGDGLVNNVILGPNGGLITGTFNLGFSAPSPTAALAQFGALHASAAATFSLPSPDTRFVVAFAQAVEQLTITAPGVASGTPGFFDVSFGFDGVISSSGAGGGEVCAGLDWNAGTSDSQVNCYSSSTSSAVAARIPIFYGVPFELFYYLQTYAGTPIVDCPVSPACPLGASFLEVSGSGSASTDFFNTMSLTGMVPLDQSFAPVANPQFSSASGTQYSVNGVVPEPGSLLLLGSGLALGARRWRRRTRLVRP